MIKNKKAVVETGISLAISLFVLAVLLFGLGYVGGRILGTLPTDRNQTVARAAIGNMTSGINNLNSLSPVLWIFVGIVILIGMAFLVYGYVKERQ